MRRFPRLGFLLEVLQAVKAGGQVVVPPRASQVSTGTAVPVSLLHQQLVLRASIGVVQAV